MCFVRKLLLILQQGQKIFCWGANCYGSETYISTDHNTLDPGEVDNIDFEAIMTHIAIRLQQPSNTVFTLIQIQQIEHVLQLHIMQ